MKCKYIMTIAACAFLFSAGSAIPQNKDTNGGENKPADNTGKNARDNSDTAVTPGDQKNSKEDRDITAKVRRAVTKKDELSTSAKNVKIITKDGKVTLRGPVKSAEEKQEIETLAKEVEGVSSVDNQIEVKEQK